MLLCNKGQYQDILTRWSKFQEFQDNWDPWIGYCGSCYEARLGGGKVFPGPTKSSGGLLKPKGDPAGSTTFICFDFGSLADTAECASMVRCANNSLHLVVCSVFFVLCFCDTTLVLQSMSLEQPATDTEPEATRRRTQRVQTTSQDLFCFVLAKTAAHLWLCFCAPCINWLIT